VDEKSGTGSNPFFRGPFELCQKWQPISQNSNVLLVSKAVAWPGINENAKYYTVGLQRVSLTFVALVLENELQYHGLAVRINSTNDASIGLSCKKFVKFEC